MRRPLLIASMILLTAAARPAAAQLRQDVASIQPPSKLYDQGGAGFSLNRYFDPQHFRMSHSFELSSGSFGGYGSTLAMYTNTMAWQFSNKLAARLDLAMAYSPTSSIPGASLTGGDSRFFVRSAEVAYRPSERMLLHFSIRQNPYGYHASPYGVYAPGAFDGYRAGQYASYDAARAESLFWNTRPR